MTRAYQACQMLWSMSTVSNASLRIVRPMTAAQWWHAPSLPVACICTAASLKITARVSADLHASRAPTLRTAVRCGFPAVRYPFTWESVQHLLLSAQSKQTAVVSECLCRLSLHMYVFGVHKWSGLLWLCSHGTA